LEGEIINICPLWSGILTHIGWPDWRAADRSSPSVSAMTRALKSTKRNIPASGHCSSDCFHWRMGSLWPSSMRFKVLWSQSWDRRNAGSLWDWPQSNLKLGYWTELAVAVCVS